jgi:Ca2+-binding EF-hand superfamily protein
MFVVFKLKNLRKIAQDLGEHITDEELAAMIDECKFPRIREGADE